MKVSEQDSHEVLEAQTRQLSILHISTWQVLFANNENPVWHWEQMSVEVGHLLQFKILHFGLHERRLC
jgi:hypothetical protein